MHHLPGCLLEVSAALRRVAGAVFHTWNECGLRRGTLRTDFTDTRTALRLFFCLIFF